MCENLFVHHKMLGRLNAAFILFFITIIFDVGQSSLCFGV